MQVAGDSQLRRPVSDAAYLAYSGRTNVSATEHNHKPVNSQSVELRLSAWSLDAPAIIMIFGAKLPPPPPHTQTHI